MTILVVTDASTDAHLRPVAIELLRRGHEVRVLDPADLIVDTSVTVRGSTHGQQTVLQWGEVTLDFDEVETVWYRKPGEVKLHERLTPSEIEWLKIEFMHLKDGLWGGLDARWVNHPAVMRTASRKLPQLRLAARLGFDVPDYLVTNEPHEARAFVASHPAGVIVKVLGRPTIVTEEAGGIIYTHLLTDEDHDQLGAVEHCPTFFQEFVDKRFDIRVTVFGEHLFAVAIDGAAHEGARVDFRNVRTFEMPHTEILLPSHLRERCIELVRELGLEFGAIDLLQTPDGRFVFLEINPNGQWLWLEDETGLPMVQAMCDLLARGATPTRTDRLIEPATELEVRAPQRWDLGGRTVSLPGEVQDRRADDLLWEPRYGTRVRFEDFDGPVRIHFGDFD